MQNRKNPFQILLKIIEIYFQFLRKLVGSNINNKLKLINMSSLNQELKKINKLYIEAMELVNYGEFRKARRILKPIERSHCISESIRATSIVYAEIFRRQNKKDEAIAEIKSNINYLWNTPDGLMILNCKNPKADKNTKLYLVDVYGGTASMGLFTCFPENYKTTFEVLANSEEEIKERILELGVFRFPENMKIEILERHELTTDYLDLNRGVIRTYPFEKYKEDEDMEDVDFEADEFEDEFGSFDVN